MTIHHDVWFPHLRLATHGAPHGFERMTVTGTHLLVRHMQSEAHMKPTGYHYELERNSLGKWYWRRVSRNGEKQFVAQAYSSRSNARRAIRNLDPNATIVTINDSV